MSFFADLLGNAALSGERVLGDHINQQQALERDTHQNNLAVERARTVAQMQQEMQAQQDQAKQKRLSDQSAVVDARAVDIGKSRRAQELLAAGAGDVSTITPEQAAVLQQAGRIKGDTALTGIDDRTAAARENGFYEMEAQLKSSRDATVKAMAEEWKQRSGDRKADQRDRQLDQGDDRNAALLARIANQSTSGSGAVKLRSTFDDSDGSKKGVMSDGSVITLSASSLAFNKEISKVVSATAKEDSRFAKLPVEEQRRRAEAQLIGLPRDASPTAADKPTPSAGYKDGTELKGPGGKIYVVKNGVPVPK